MSKEKHILVVDDEVSITEMMQFVLEDQGYDITTAGNGKEGLERIQAQKPDLIITDISMPDMEGIEFLRELKRNGIGIPVIVMSGNIIGRKFLESARRFGAKGSVLKPFSKAQLLQEVERCLQL